MYSQFRETHYDWFVNDTESPVLPTTLKHGTSEFFVPVVPTLSSVFYQLQLIDSYRVTQDSRMLTDLVQEQVNLSLVKKESSALRSQVK